MLTTPMQEMFDLNTAIDQLKSALTKDYNFEVKPGELECNVHIFCQSESYPEVVQDAFTEFNRCVKQNLQMLIDNLVEERDKMTMQILANQAKSGFSSYKDENGNVHIEANDLCFNCDGLHCTACTVEDCPHKN